VAALAGMMIFACRGVGQGAWQDRA
jgi:hypothetical protein